MLCQTKNNSFAYYLLISTDSVTSNRCQETWLSTLACKCKSQCGLPALCRGKLDDQLLTGRMAQCQDQTPSGSSSWVSLRQLCYCHHGMSKLGISSSCSKRTKPKLPISSVSCHHVCMYHTFDKASARCGQTFQRKCRMQQT